MLLEIIQKQNNNDQNLDEILYKFLSIDYQLDQKTDYKEIIFVMNDSSILNQTNKGIKQDQENCRLNDLQNYLTPHHHNTLTLSNDIPHNISSSQQFFHGRRNSRYMQSDLLNLINDKTIFYQTQNKMNNKGLIEIKSQLYQNLRILKNFNKNCSRILDSSTLLQKLVTIINSIPVISPSGNFKFIWDIIMIIVILLYLFMIPIEVTFYQPLKELFPYNLLLVCNIALIIDFTLQWNFGFFDKGQPNMNRMQVMIKYFRSQFYIDIASSLFVLIDFYWYNNNVSSLVQLLLLILIVSHIISCVWIEVLQYEIKNDFKNTWIGNSRLKQNDWVSNYIHAYYFSTVTMITVGYGDYTPSNPTEMVISIITMLLSCGVFAYSINAIGTIFNTLNQKSLAIKNNMYTISSYMAKKNIDFDLQMQIKEYLEYYWNMQYSRDEQQEQNLINQLSPKLKERLLLETFKMIIIECQIFKDNFSQQFIMDIIQLIQECSYRPDEIILSESIQDDHSLYFIESGQVQVFVDEDAKKVLKNLKKGDFFGDYSFFTGQQTNLNYKATEFTQVFKIKRSNIFELFQNKPQDLEAFCNIKDTLLFTQNYSIINSKCYYCSDSHLTTNCSKLFPQFNKIRIANISNQSDMQIRQNLSGERKLHYQQDIDYYYQKYIWKEGDEDIEEELSGNLDEESNNQSSFNINSQQDLPSLEFEKQRSRRYSRNSSQISFKRNKQSSSNFEDESQLQKSPAAKLKSKQNIIDEISDQNHLNLKKINSKDQQIMESPIVKRRLIKVQQIQTSFKGVNALQQRLPQVSEYQQIEALTPQNKQYESPIRVPSQRLQLQKNNQMYDKTLKEQISPQTKILADSNKSSELILKLQQIFEQQNNLKEKNEQSEEENYINQYPFNIPGCQRNFQILRVFERKVKQQNLKKKQKNNRNSISQLVVTVNQNVRSSLPNTKLQKVLEKYQYVSQNQDDTISLEQLLPNIKLQINNQIEIHNIKNDGDHRAGIRQNSFSIDNKQLLSSQKKSLFLQSESQINSDTTIFQIALSEKFQSQSGVQSEIESPSQQKKQEIHSTQQIAQKEKYFQSDDRDNSNQVNQIIQNIFSEDEYTLPPITQQNNQRIAPFKKKLSQLHIEKQHF
ncbi:cyclic nucleotide-binding domain protein (macronuclear) [Tetrahymena thermophila SB210]|uniref:Cyclic nucleotide-binding domain protein n=1 Tax=Tetrahymena thermophila (strain SB210) TaxID=312017 RepID=I7LXZ6_TETTS|nr:cyclic nucleotide-binding domain protein [Tetrahymena thermophila SB210]EAS07057.2 cyclic nucleotide-binding domain protein [Tetrahymena thermophila SB210]|eukprot:XP_001027299.2 cyclic nucleotide-binding domain protein [Tetrahymena thermophila SB210]